MYFKLFRTQDTLDISSVVSSVILLVAVIFKVIFMLDQRIYSLPYPFNDITSTATFNGGMYAGCITQVKARTICYKEAAIFYSLTLTKIYNEISSNRNNNFDGDSKQNQTTHSVVPNGYSRYRGNDTIVYIGDNLYDHKATSLSNFIKITSFVTLLLCIITAVLFIPIGMVTIFFRYLSLSMIASTLILDILVKIIITKFVYSSRILYPYVQFQISYYLSWFSIIFILIALIFLTLGVYCQIEWKETEND